MSEINPYSDVPVKTLNNLRALQVESIERERLKLEQIELAIRSQNRPEMRDLLSIDEQRQLLTSGGSVRDVAGWAHKILKAHDKVMKASEIAEVMYSYSWPISLPQFKRRVIVAVSAIANQKNMLDRTIVKGGTASNREALWALPEWMFAGTLNPAHSAKKEIMKET